MKTKEKPVVQLLKAARAKIKLGWCRRAHARDKNNRQVSADDSRACKFCATGALWACFSTGAIHWRARRFLEAAAGENIIDFNDRRSTTQAKMLAVYSEAIRAARK